MEAEPINYFSTDIARVAWEALTNQSSIESMIKKISYYNNNNKEEDRVEMFFNFLINKYCISFGTKGEFLFLLWINPENPNKIEKITDEYLNRIVIQSDRLELNNANSFIDYILKRKDGSEHEIWKSLINSNMKKEKIEDLKKHFLEIKDK